MAFIWGTGKLTIWKNGDFHFGSLCREYIKFSLNFFSNCQTLLSHLDSLLLSLETEKSWYLRVYFRVVWKLFTTLLFHLDYTLKNRLGKHLDLPERICQRASEGKRRSAGVFISQLPTGMVWRPQCKLPPEGRMLGPLWILMACVGVFAQSHLDRNAYLILSAFFSVPKYGQKQKQNEFLLSPCLSAYFEMKCLLFHRNFRHSLHFQFYFQI